MTTDSTHTTPAPIDPRHVFYTAKEVHLRFGWGRTYGYEMLRSTGFPRAIGGRFRLDTLMAWEELVLAGALTGCPDPKAAHPGVPDVQHRVPELASRALDPAPPDVTAALGGELVAAPRRNRTRGLRKAA